MVTMRGERTFSVVVNLILIIVGIISIFPILYVVSMSLTPYGEVVKNGGFLIIPRAISFDAYIHLLKGNELPRAMGVSVFLAVIGTAISLLLNLLGAFPLSRKDLQGRTVFLFLIVFTMLFGGGMIPTYLLVKSLGMLDTVWAMIIPGAVATFNLLIMKTFFEGLPEELFEAARIDGAGELKVLVTLVIPLSLPSMLTIGLFYMVGYWNSFFAALYYVTNPNLYPLQIVLRKMLMMSTSLESVMEQTLPTPTLQMAAVVLASAPMLIIYPFIQKHFTKGMLIGAIKG
ncbi:carbohydrate ABC transporter permease [Paenibacillus sp. FSL R10-2734]|uniref:carbohydrate ABC transporter permease n=1 Tax=Paenibacillus sp. FSL R10-2734 TaxID=2954691 RepID=UPI0030DAB525